LALEGQQQLVGRHSDAVVGDTDERGPAIAQIDRDRQAPASNAFSTSSLDGGSRALDRPPPGRDLVDEVVGAACGCV